MNSNLKPTWLTTRYIYYPIMGYYLDQKADKIKLKKYLPLIWGYSLLLIVMCLFLTYHKAEATGILKESESQTFYSKALPMQCIAIFATIKAAFDGKNLSDRTTRIICVAGKSTFGVYLLHILIRRNEDYVLLSALRQAGVSPMLSALSYCLIMMIVSSLLTLILSKIPLLKKLMGY